MDRTAPTAEEARIIDELMHASRPITIGSVAKALGTTDLEAAAKLPAHVCRFASGNASERFAEIWEALCAWEKTTLFIEHAGSVFEISGRLSAGKIGWGYYNILSRGAAVGGHLNYADIKAVAFLSMPFMGRESLSVQFFNRAGEAVFAVYAGREAGKIIPAVKRAFEADRSRFCTDGEAR